MATLIIEARRGVGESSSARYQFNSKAETLLTIEGEDMVFPLGCRDLEVQPRLCGDFYAEIKGLAFHVANIGDTPAEAVKRALYKVDLALLAKTGGDQS